MVAPAFPPEETAAVYRAIRERRDVRRGFLPTPLDEPLLQRLLQAACWGPSVGLMQPARFIVIRDEQARKAVRNIFLRANEDAAKGYEADRQSLYQSLKLEGLLEAPQHLCVLCDEATTQGHGLGRQTMPETAAYSVVCAIENLWLAARAEGVGVGWVSIVDPAALRNLLRIPTQVRLVAYLCLGYVEEFAAQPDLERCGWETRRPHEAFLHSECFDRPYSALKDVP